MKITRLKKGFVIHVTDTEMSVLQDTVCEGMGSSMWDDAERGYSHMPPAEQRIITEVNANKRDWMVVTEDRRAK